MSNLMQRKNLAQEEAWFSWLMVHKLKNWMLWEKTITCLFFEKCRDTHTISGQQVQLYLKILCVVIQSIFSNICVYFYAYIWIYTSSKIPSDYSTNEKKKKKKAIELTLFNIFQSLSLSMSKTAKAAFWNRSFSSSKDFFLSKAKFLHFSTSSMIPEEFWSISLQRIHGEIPKKEKKKISI